MAAARPGTRRANRITRSAVGALLALGCAAAGLVGPAVTHAGTPVGAPGSNLGQGPGATGRPVPSNAGPGVTGPPVGQGAGYHSPQSQFPPLKEREGVVPWAVLSSVTTKVDGPFVRPVYTKPAQALNNQTVMVQGFMMPLEPGDKQRHFLLSAVPTTCNFCIPAGPEGLVEVLSKTPVTFTQHAIVVQGKMAVLASDPYGMYYRLSDSKAIDVKTLK